MGLALLTQVHFPHPSADLREWVLCVIGGFGVYVEWAEGDGSTVDGGWLIFTRGKTRTVSCRLSYLKIFLTPAKGLGPMNLRWMEARSPT